MFLQHPKCGTKELNLNPYCRCTVTSATVQLFSATMRSLGLYWLMQKICDQHCGCVFFLCILNMQTKKRLSSKYLQLPLPKDCRKCLHGDELDKEEVGETGTGLYRVAGSLRDGLLSLPHGLVEQEDRQGFLDGWQYDLEELKQSTSS